ncbi:hypothetical protein NPIL_321001 [Nephila pilipes]|uniref:Uncharacterized protein n=1 Tax=Nephila pilipes TaxID=299642 RepID=A0A8X6M8U9_NEPPI|nr:hypothetical protein NPIL_321001 [Nephila pilipes]
MWYSWIYVSFIWYFRCIVLEDILLSSGAATMDETVWEVNVPIHKVGGNPWMTGYRSPENIFACFELFSKSRNYRVINTSSKPLDIQDGRDVLLTPLALPSYPVWTEGT